MKKLILSILTLTLLFSFYSCKKDKITNNVNETTQNNYIDKDDGGPPPGYVYSLAEIENTLLSTGWTASTVPATYTPYFSGYTNIYRFTKFGNSIYIYKFSSSAEARQEGNNCTRKWHSNPLPHMPWACYDDGSV